MKDNVPTLRQDIVLEPHPEGRGVIAVDALLARRIRLDDRGAAIAQALKQPCDRSSLCQRLAIDGANLDRILAVFASQHLLDTEETQAHLASARSLLGVIEEDRQRVPLVIHPRVAFTCTMCGGCCGGHNIGPVSQQVLDGLAPHMDTLANEIGSDKGLFFALPPSDPQGEPRVLCQSSCGSCVFLSEDNRCRIHANLGGDHKPVPCRLFPYTFMATPDGIVVSISAECRGLVDARQGRPLINQEQEVRALLELVPPQFLDRVPLRVQLRPDCSISYARWCEIETRLLDVVVSHASTPFAMFGAMTALLATASGSAPSQPATEDEIRENWQGFLAGISDAMKEIHDARVHDDERLLVHGESLALLIVSLAELRDNPERVFSDAVVGRHKDLIATIYTQRLSGKALLKGANVGTSLALMIFEWLAARAVMTYRARQVKRRVLTDQDVMDSVALLRFVMRTEEVSELFGRLADPMQWLLGQQLALLPTAVMGGASERRIELYAF